MARSSSSRERLYRALAHPFHVELGDLGAELAHVRWLGDDVVVDEKEFPEAESLDLADVAQDLVDVAPLVASAVHAMDRAEGAGLGAAPAGLDGKEVAYPLFQEEVVARDGPGELGRHALVAPLEPAGLEVGYELGPGLLGVPLDDDVEVLFGQLRDQGGHGAAHDDGLSPRAEFLGEVDAAPGGVPHAPDAHEAGVRVEGHVLYRLEADLGLPVGRQEGRQHGVGEAYEVELALLHGPVPVVVDGGLDEEDLLLRRGRSFHALASFPVPLRPGERMSRRYCRVMCIAPRTVRSQIHGP